MKKMIKFFALAAIAALACVSCNKEIEVSVASVEDGIKVMLAAEPITKTYIEGTTAKWKATDAVGVFTGTDTQNRQFTNTHANGEDALFAGSVVSTGTFYAYYPYTAGDAVVAMNGVKYKFPETQYPTPTSYDGAADLLLSKSINIDSTDPETINVQFRRLGGFLKFVFTDGTTGGVLAGEHVEQVTVVVDNKYGDGSKRPCPSVYVTPSGFGEIGAGMKTIKAVYEADAYALTASGNATWFGVYPQTFANTSTFNITITTDNYRITRLLTLASDVTLGAGDILPISVSLKDADLGEKAVANKSVWKLSSSETTPWTTVFGGAANCDRNIAMDDEYVYIAESGAAANLYALSLTDGAATPVDVTGVSGGTHALTCPRVIKNTDPSVNGGKDVLICCSLTRGGEEPKLYLWLNGINSAPAVVELTTSATTAWYGDTFTVHGTLQNGTLFFDKTGGENVNGIVTFDLTGVPGAQLYLHKRIDFNTPYYNFPAYAEPRAHSGVCAYYPFPEDINSGVYSPGRGNAYRGMSSTFEGDLKSVGNSAFTPTLAELEYADGRNGYVLAYNFIEWKGHRYVIYGVKNGTTGKVYILEGSTSTPWLTIANTAAVKFRIDILRADGCTLTSGASAMDIAARVIGEDLYIAAQNQSIGCIVNKLHYE